MVLRPEDTSLFSPDRCVPLNRPGQHDGILLSENRRGSRINKSPFLVFRVIPLGYWPDFNLESVFIIKNKFVMKNVSDFVKTVETGVDPRQDNLIPLIAGNFSNQLQNK